MAQRLLFYYVFQNITSVEKYWQQEGDLWSAAVDRFVTPGKLRDAVAQIVAPDDTDDQKLKKIYAAVMKVENTSFTRTLSQAEDKRLKLKFSNAADIWKQQRGDDDDMALLFIGLARAAGLRAYAIMVSDRDRNIFIREQLDWSQLDDILAIVDLGGKEMFFDPGERYCEYGKLQWAHTGTMGVRQTAKGPTELAQTPSPVYKDNIVVRTASLHLATDGAVTGVVRIVMNGEPALRWRQEALRTDEQAAKTSFEQELKKSLPDAVDAKMIHFVGLADTGQLMAIVDVSGHLGTRTGKRLFLPGEFFEAKAALRFGSEKRENAVDLRYPFIVEDDIRIELPPGLALETIPAGVDLPLGHWAQYRANYISAKDGFEEQRTLGVGNIFYKVDEYPQLRAFFQKISAQDQTQMVLIASPPTNRAASPSAGTNCARTSVIADTDAEHSVTPVQTELLLDHQQRSIAIRVQLIPLPATPAQTGPELLSALVQTDPELPSAPVQTDPGLPSAPVQTDPGLRRPGLRLPAQTEPEPPMGWRQVHPTADRRLPHNSIVNQIHLRIQSPVPSTPPFGNLHPFP